MQNFSCSTKIRKKPQITEEEIETNIEIEPVKEFSTTTTTTTAATHSSKEDMSEIQYMMSSMEELRIRNPDQFAIVICNSKQILDMVKSNEVQTKEDVAILEKLFYEVEKIDIDYLFWCSNKSIRIAAIDYKNLLLIHFFIIQKGYRLENKNIYHNFLNDYIRSLQDVDFINSDDKQIYLYVTIMQMLITKGGCDVNDNETDDINNTPLHYAVAFKQLQFIIVLLKFPNTDVNALNMNGCTPLDFAVQNLGWKKDVTLNTEICKLLVMHGGKTHNMTQQYNELFVEIDETVKEEKTNKDDKVSP